MFELTMEDFVPQVDDIISVGEFYEKATGRTDLHERRLDGSTRALLR